MDNIETTYGGQFLWSTPIEYKTITLYPVLCKDLQMFYAGVYALLYDPIRYSGGISTLPRLYFLTDILNHQDDDGAYIQQNMMLVQLFAQLGTLLALVFQEQKFEFVENKGRWFIRVYSNEEEYFDIKAKDFDIIREIILHQNGVDYDDTFVHEDIREWIAQQEASEKKSSATLEDYMEVFMMQTGSCDIEVFKRVSLRRFNRMIDKILSRENYTIQMTASMSGFVTFKEKIDHWITINKKNSIYDKYFKECK